MEKAATFDYFLGLDIGVKSIGWAIVPEKKAKFKDLVLGVRCFDSGTGTESDIESGNDTSRNVDRRMARGVRRNLHRRAVRVKTLLRCLQERELLPKGDFRSPEARHQMFVELDRQLIREFCSPEDRVSYHLLPYILRAKGLDEKLPPYAFGRAIYHLAQRRGFLSNRKSGFKDADKEEGKVKAGISSLQEEIEAKGTRTLGEFFASLDPEETRIRQRWTSRKMYQEEFELLWKRQEGFYPNWTKEFHDAVFHAIFFQRPLKSQRSKLGMCSLETGKRRAPLACLEFQQFRYWQFWIWNTRQVRGNVFP